MSQDPLLRHLAEEARARQAREASDLPWEQLAAGTLSPAERQRLEPAAAKDPELAARLAECAPLDAAARERIASRLAQRLQKAPAPTSRRLRWRRMFPAVAAGAVALAASLVLVLAPDRRGGSLPEYEVTLSGQMAVRGTAAGAELPSLGPGSSLELLLRPARPVEGDIEARAFLMRDGAARVWPVTPERSEDGAIRIAGLVDSLLPAEAGEWTAVILVGRPGDVRARVEDVPAVVATGREGLRVLTARFQRTVR